MEMEHGFHMSKLLLALLIPHRSGAFRLYLDQQNCFGGRQILQESLVIRGYRSISGVLREKAFRNTKRPVGGGSDFFLRLCFLFSRSPTLHPPLVLSIYSSFTTRYSPNYSFLGGKTGVGTGLGRGICAGSGKESDWVDDSMYLISRSFSSQMRGKEACGCIQRLRFVFVLYSHHKSHLRS